MKKILAFLTVCSICAGMFISVSAATKSRKMTVQIGNNTATVDGEQKDLDSEPVIINDRTMVPLRFISENFGFDVDWNGESEMVTITGSENKNNPNAAHLGEDYYIFELSENVTRTAVTYKNRYGIELSGDLYASKDLDTSAKYPAIVIGPPYGGVKEQGPGVYANQLAQRGFVVLAFDPSYNGESGGEPRHISSPDIFAEDFSAGVDYLGTLSYIDREKIGALGICGSGGFALSAAQADARIKAVCTSAMYDISGFGAAMDKEQWQAAIEVLATQRWADVDSGEMQYIPSFPTEPDDKVPSDLTGSAAEFYEFYGLKRGHHPRALGGFTTTSNMAMNNFQSLNHIDMISPRPILFITGDIAHSKMFSETAYANAAEPKELYVVEGAMHIDLYDDVTKIPFDKIETFFKTNLK